MLSLIYLFVCVSSCICLHVSVSEGLERGRDDSYQHSIGPDSESQAAPEALTLNNTV